MMQLIESGDKILCALSGGADSIVMTHLLKSLENELNITVFACHLNHKTRGDESLRDLNFSKEFCKNLNIPFYSESIDITLDKSKGFEASARDIRYDFFKRAKKHFNANKIATAHNADDNLETILLNISRGTGLLGLLGIPEKRDDIIRPILKYSRTDIENYIKEHNLCNIFDSSNATTDYSRNKIRLKAIPVLKEINSAVVSNATKMSENLKNDYDFIAKFSNIAYNDIVDLKNNNFSIDISKLLALDLAISFRVICEVLKNFDHTLSNDKFYKILDLCKNSNPSAKLLFYKGVEIKRNYQNLVFCAPHFEDEKISFVVCDEVITIYTNKFDNLLVEYQISFDDIDIPSLYIKKRESGDFLYQNNHKKIIKKLLIDKKIPKDVRDFLPILCDKDGIISVLHLGISRKKGLQKIVFRSIQ